MICVYHQFLPQSLRRTGYAAYISLYYLCILLKKAGSQVSMLSVQGLRSNVVVNCGNWSFGLYVEKEVLIVGRVQHFKRLSILPRQQLVKKHALLTPAVILNPIRRPNGQVSLRLMP